MSELSLDQGLLQGMRWRCIGPPRGGRVVAVAGHPTEPSVFYFGACAGGVWKTVDGGAYWENISDGFFQSAAVGAIAVAPSDPNVLYVGTGESTIRIDVSYGDGVYKSTDGGQTWGHVGLSDTHHIARVRVHPTNPDWVYVAALGHAFGPNTERGVFRSKDGGQSWEKILYRSDRAGAIDLSLDPTNPRVLYASFWETYRHFWTLSSGGPGSGLFKSTDGGDTWTELTDRPGLPRGIKGKMGVAVSPASPNRVWAIIEAEKPGLYRSDDGGVTWALVSDNQELLHRPWYYCHVFADPQDPDTVYVLNLKMLKSTDGGCTFTEITTPHGDNHDLWIDPNNPQRMIEGNDGGACVSFNGGESWSSIYNQLTAQFYHVAVDSRFPYHVYGTQQDNSSIAVPSATEKGAITLIDCYPAGTGESGYIAVHPQDPNIVYVGAVGSSPGGGAPLQRYDHRTRQIRLITVWPQANISWGPKALKYRFAWTYPIVISPHDPGTLYVAGNHVFRSTDEGSSWEPISPDLTRADEEKLEPSGGPITKDCSGAEHYATIFAFVESPHEAGVFWAGSDDGLIHISRDGGQHWENVTPPDLPEWTLISMIEASPHDPGTVYVAGTRYKLDDYQPYLYKTTDYGQTWHNLSPNFPDGEITRVIREDPVCQGLLYVGTETGVFVSLDDGAGWQRLQNNLPVVPVYDLVIKDDDLVVGTHGRSFWILDSVVPLRQMAQTPLQSSFHLFQPGVTVRRWLAWGAYGSFNEKSKNYRMAFGVPMAFYERRTPEGEPVRKVLDGGENPPQGVIVYYALQEEPAEPISLTFLDANGQEIRTFTQKPADGTAPTEEEDRKVRYVSAQRGLNRFVWDMRYPEATRLPGDVTTKDATTGPLAPPGVYQVRLKVGQQTMTHSFEIRADPRTPAGQAELEAQFALWMQIRDKLSQTHETVIRLRDLREQLQGWTGRLALTDERVMAMARTMTEKLTTIEKALVQTEARHAFDSIRLPTALNFQLVALMSVVSAADEAPTQQAYDVFEHLSEQIDKQLQQWQTIVEQDVPAFNALMREAGVPALVI